MRDCIKTERARNIISFMTGKIVKITEEDGTSREKICTGIYGTGEATEMQHVCLSFEADYQQDNDGTCGAQLSYSDWEQLINTGCWYEECMFKIELV